MNTGGRSTGAMSYAAERSGATLMRLDQEVFNGDAVHELHRLIRESNALIADLSDGNPNVLYEVGYAHALEIPSVHISSTPLSKLPFDVQGWNTLPYEKGQTSRLKEPLARRLRAALDLS